MLLFDAFYIRGLKSGGGGGNDFFSGVGTQGINPQHILIEWMIVVKEGKQDDIDNTLIVCYNFNKENRGTYSQGKRKEGVNGCPGVSKEAEVYVMKEAII